MEPLTVEQQLEQYREDYAQLSREFQLYREVKEAEILTLRDELEQVEEAFGSHMCSEH
jgi:hypothetical protein